MNEFLFLLFLTRDVVGKVQWDERGADRKQTENKEFIVVTSKKPRRTSDMGGCKQTSGKENRIILSSFP